MSEMSTVREARDDDAHRISELLAELGYELDAEGVIESLADYRGGDDRVLVGELGGSVEGFLSFHVVPFFHARGRGGRITAMCVSVEHRRAGIGRLLMEAVEEYGRAARCHQIEVTSGDHRASGAHQFYEAMGYAPTSQRFLKRLI